MLTEYRQGTPLCPSAPTGGGNLNFSATTTLIEDVLGGGEPGVLGSTGIEGPAPDPAGGLPVA